MTRRLSTADIRRYDEEGYLAGLPVLNATGAQACGDVLTKLVRQREQDSSLADLMYYKSHLAFRWLAELAIDPRILDAVEALLGPDLLLWNSSFLPKAPHSDSWFTWHQDATYWGLVPPHALTVWLAFSDVTPASGAMRIIPGSHKAGQLRHEATFDPKVMLPRGQRIVDPLDEAGAVDIALRPGEMSIHGIYTVHGSGPNTTDSWRLGCNLTFLSTEVCPQAGRETAMLVRGSDRYGHFDTEPWPDGDLTPAAIAAHTAATARMGTRATEPNPKPGA